MFKTTGRVPAQFEGPPEPRDMMYLLEWYKEVHDGEQLTYRKLRDWSEMVKVDVCAWEVRVLIMIDGVYWKIKGETK